MRHGRLRIALRSVLWTQFHAFYVPKMAVLWNARPFVGHCVAGIRVPASAVAEDNLNAISFETLYASVGVATVATVSSMETADLM